MASHQELISTKYMTEPLESEELPNPVESVHTPTGRNTANQVAGGVKLFLAFVLGAAIYTTAGNWATDKASKSTKVADWFLWGAGSDKTWDQYQKGQIAKGNPRLKDKELGWVGQLIQDAYAGNNR